MKRPEALAWLNLIDPFTDEELRDAYRAACKAAHPDAGGTSTQFHDVTAAYDVLKGSGTPSAPASRSKTCLTCSGTGKVAKPSRKLGAKPLQVRCKACNGEGLR